MSLRMRMIALSLLFIAITLKPYARAADDTPEEICPTEIGAFGEAAVPLELGLDGHERISTHFQWLVGSEIIQNPYMVVAGKIIWDDETSGLGKGQAEPGGSLIALDIESGGTFPFPVFNSLQPNIIFQTDQPDVYGINNARGFVNVFQHSVRKSPTGDDTVSVTESKYHIVPAFAHRGGAGPVANSIALSPDKKTLLVLYPLGDAYLLDAQTGEEKFRLQLDVNLQSEAIDPERRPSMPLGPFDAAFTPDGKHIVSAHMSGIGAIWDASSGDAENAFEIPFSIATSSPSIFMSPHTDHLVFATTVASNAQKALGPTVEFWSLEKTAISERDGAELPHATRIRTIVLTEDYAPLIRFGPHKTILMGTDEGNIEIFDRVVDAEMKKPTQILAKSHKAPISALAISEDGKRYASGCENGVLTLWSTEKEKKHIRIAGNKDRITGLFFSSDGKWLVIETQDPNDTMHGFRLSAINHLYRVDLEALNFD